MKTIMLKIMNKRFLGFIILVLVTGFFVTGLWPFNVTPEVIIQIPQFYYGMPVYGPPDTSEQPGQEPFFPDHDL